jgi:type IV secretion system protein VirB10
MTERSNPDDSVQVEPPAEVNGNTITPLPGEPGIPNVAARQPISWSKKGLLGVALLMLGMVGLSAFSIQRFAASGHNGDKETKLVRDRPFAASAGTRRLDMAVAPAPLIPALLPVADEVVEPIGVRRTGQQAPAAGPKGLSPEDAPVLVVSSRPGAYPSGSGAPTQRPGAPGSTQVAGTTDEGFDPDDPIATTSRNLQGYQRQLQG